MYVHLGIFLGVQDRCYGDAEVGGRTPEVLLVFPVSKMVSLLSRVRAIGDVSGPPSQEKDGIERTGGAEVIRDRIGPYSGIDALDRGSSHVLWEADKKSDHPKI